MSSLALVIQKENTDDSIVCFQDKKFVAFYEEFLKSQRSVNTEMAYRTDLTQFFKFTFNKEPKFVTLNDMLKLTSLEAMAYHNSLKGKKNATIKRKINAVKSFLSALKVDHKDINVNIFDNINLASVNLDREAYGNLDWEEAFLFIEYAHIEQMEGNQMAMLLKLACISSIRLDTLLSLTWDGNFRVKNERGIAVNYIDAVDKMTRHQTPLSNNFYNELREKLGSTGKLFPSLHKHKVGEFLRQILDYFEIDPKRNIKFHSFKKCGVNRVLEKTGDLTKAQIQGKHKSIVTTQNNYIELKDDLTLRPSFTLDQDIDIIKEIKDLTRDELLQAITRMSDSAKFELLRSINRG